MKNNTPIFLLRAISLSHIFLLTISNILVQYPFELWGFHTTWGAFTYPIIFILTDLTTRITSADMARKIVFRSMVPGLFISYGITSYIEGNGLLIIHIMPLRIAFACFFSYVIGQLIDILVFQRYREKTSWWLAPVLSTTIGSTVDTFLFFSIAFYHCSNPTLSQHWPEIAAVDLFFKMMISLFAFVPVYGVILNAWRTRRLSQAA